MGIHKFLILSKYTSQNQWCAAPHCQLKSPVQNSRQSVAQTIDHELLIPMHANSRRTLNEKVDYKTVIECG